MRIFRWLRKYFPSCTCDAHYGMLDPECKSHSACNAYYAEKKIEAAPSAIRDLRDVSAEMRNRKINHGKTTSPTLIAWADKIDDAIARLGGDPT